jgi:AcrR family transcriptional regulator
LTTSDTRAAPRALPKGRQTRAAILEAALGLASHMGLEGLSIGALAELMRMSKSGVFAHFGSREELQISVIREYHERFAAEVFAPAIREPRGLPRLRALFERWLRRVSVEIDSGCIYISGGRVRRPARCGARRAGADGAHLARHA